MDDLLITSIGSGLTALLGWIGQFLGNLLNAPTEGEETMYVLIPIVGLNIAFGIFKFGLYSLKSLTFGF